MIANHQKEMYFTHFNSLKPSPRKVGGQINPIDDNKGNTRVAI